MAKEKTALEIATEHYLNPPDDIGQGIELLKMEIELYAIQQQYKKADEIFAKMSEVKK